MKLTAIFETWHIGDGNYPPLNRGQQVNLSFEMCPSRTEKIDVDQPGSLLHLGGGTYRFSGKILRVYSQEKQDAITIIQSGDFRFYVNRDLGMNEGNQLQGEGDLFLDHFIWVEFLDRRANPPDLFYQLIVQGISRVKIPERHITRNASGKALPPSLSPSDYHPEDVVEVETMEGQALDEEFYLLDLTSEGISGSVPFTFQL